MSRTEQKAVKAVVTPEKPPLVVYPGRVVVERVEQGRLELDLHRVVRLSTLLLDVYDSAKPALADPLDVQEVVRTHLEQRRVRPSQAIPHAENVTAH